MRSHDGVDLSRSAAPKWQASIEPLMLVVELGADWPDILAHLN